MKEARHGKFVKSGNVTYRVNNSDPEWVTLETMDGQPVARQSKLSSGRVYQQSTTNPDYKGRESYSLEYVRNGEWVEYDSQARKGEIFNQTFLDRMQRKY